MTTLRKMVYAGALAIATTAMPALANNNTIDLGTIAPGTTSPAMSAHARGSFTDTITFNLTKGGDDGGIAYFNFASRFTNIADAILSLAGPTSLTRSLHDGYDEMLALAGGSYTGTITGRATGTAGGSYSLGITAPTPEPEIWLSLVAGTAMAGFMARRRRQTQTA